ncbi:MAG: hypothetical protein ACK4NW_02045 [Roseinatronobacter sp.]
MTTYTQEQMEAITRAAVNAAVKAAVDHITNPPIPEPSIFDGLYGPHDDLKLAMLKAADEAMSKATGPDRDSDKEWLESASL